MCLMHRKQGAKLCSQAWVLHSWQPCRLGLGQLPAQAPVLGHPTCALHVRAGSCSAALPLECMHFTSESLLLMAQVGTSRAIQGACQPGLPLSLLGRIKPMSVACAQPP